MEAGAETVAARIGWKMYSAAPTRERKNKIVKRMQNAGLTGETPSVFKRQGKKLKDKILGN